MSYNESNNLNSQKIDISYNSSSKTKSNDFNDSTIINNPELEIIKKNGKKTDSENSEIIPKIEITKRNQLLCQKLQKNI